MVWDETVAKSGPDTLGKSSTHGHLSTLMDEDSGEAFQEPKSVQLRRSKKGRVLMPTT